MWWRIAAHVGALRVARHRFEETAAINRSLSIFNIAI